MKEKIILKDISIAKGIGIILVVWAHACGPLSNYINQFHMPFFFFISGLLYTSIDETNKIYFLRKLRSLLAPYWWWNLLLYPVFFLLYYWKHWSIHTLIQDVVKIILTVDKVPFLGATWFLAALFWTSVSVHFFLRLLGHLRLQDYHLLWIGLIGCILGFYHTFPYRISRILICALFYICGYLYKKYIKATITGRIKDLFAIALGIFYIAIANYNTVSMADNQYQNKVVFLIGALAATAFILRFSYWLSIFSILDMLSKHLAYLGRNTLCIVIWQFLAFRVTIIFQILTGNANIKSIVAFPVYDASGAWWMLYLAAGIYVSLGWQYILGHNPLTPFMKKVHMIS